MLIQKCPLCASDIDPGSKDWRACYQELDSTDDSETPTQSLPSPSIAAPDRFAARVHYACWRIACLHSSVLNLSSLQFLLFKQCMLDLAPVQTALDSPESPNECNMFNRLEEPPSNTVLTLGTLACLSNELLYQVLENFTDVHDADNFVQTTGADFPSALYRNIFQQSFGMTFDIDNPSHVNRGLCYSPSLVNHTVIWENVKRILKHMDRPFNGVDSAIIKTKLNLTWPAENAIHTADILQMTGQPSRVEFHFSCFETGFYLTGVGVDGNLVGYEGDQVYTERLQPTLSGIRLVYNDVGIITIQIRSGNCWSARIGGQGNDLMKQKNETFFSESWDLAGSDILASFDSVKLISIAVPPDGQNVIPSVCIFRNDFCRLRTRPSPVIVPTIPHSWDVLHLRTDVMAFSVFVLNTEQTIVGIEVQYSDGTSSQIGLDDESVVKLTLCLSLGGAYSSTFDDNVIQLVRVGRSRNGNTLAMELLTTHRSFTIGTFEENQTVDFELPTAMIYAFSHDNRPTPCAVGFALPSESPATKPMPYYSETRPVQSINFNPEPHQACDGLFRSKARLFGIVGIIAYSRSDPPKDICGMAFAYNFEPPMILGQARKRCGSSQKLGTDNVREIFVYYEPYMFGRRVVGIRLFSWSSHEASFGNCSGSLVPEILRVSNEADDLVWRFNQSYSELTLQSTEG